MYEDFEDYEFEDIELYEHKRSDKVKWIVSFLLIFVLLAGLIGAWAMLLEDRFKPEEEEQQEEEVIEEESGTAEVRSVALAMKAAAAANGGVSKELTATVYPSDARNKAVDWTLEWLDTEKEETLSEYLTLVPSSDGANTATLTCLKAFEGEALITVTTREGGYIDTCRVVFVGDPTSLAVSCEEATTASGSFGSYYELGVGNSYTFDLTPGNVFGFVGAECNYTYTVTGYGSIKVQQQKYSTSNDSISWTEGTESTVNINDITTVSRYEPSVFDWAIDGNKLTVTVNCTPESYYTSSQRVENTITYENKFREYTDDNWYYEIKVTETNSGVSHTFKVRPVKVVTNVVLGDDVITF